MTTYTCDELPAKQLVSNGMARDGMMICVKMARVAPASRNRPDVKERR